MLTIEKSWPPRAFRMPMAFVAAFGVCASGLSCEKPAPVEKIPAPQLELVVFATHLRVDDAAVNEFVEHTMRTCVTGDYDAFRLLWSATSEPMGRRDFERSWKAVRQIRLDTLVPFRIAAETGEPRLRYYLEASVDLDPAADPPTRSVQLVAVHEESQWRLARPSKTQLDKIAEAIAQADGTAAP